MKNNITWNPLLPTTSGTYCHLLTINTTRILINCGGPSESYTSDILSIINTVDCILITSFDFSCVEGLWNILDAGFFKPVYMSVPIKEYSLIFHPTEYKNIIDLKYLQPFTVNGIQICAFACGNSLGASFFKITANLENIYIGYNINHRKENHLNGIDLKKITDSYIFITNTSYCYKENINVGIRNDQLLGLINNWFSTKSKKMIIYTTYPRFHEIGLVLNEIKNKKIVVMNKFIDKFINKSKNMIEWSNSKLIEQNDVYEYSNIEKIENFSKLSTFDICVLLDEDISLLDKYNSEDTCVVFTDKKIDVSIKEVYEYKGVYEIKSEIREEDLDEESSDEEIEHHWSELNCEIYLDINMVDRNYLNINKVDKNYLNINKVDRNYNIDKLNNTDKLTNNVDKNYNTDKLTNKVDKYSNTDKLNNTDKNILRNSINEEYSKLYGNNEENISKNKNKSNFNDKLKFNKNKRLRNYDNYGEYINKDNYIIKVEKREFINEPVKVEKIYKETRTLVKTGIDPKYKSVIFNLQGCSDLKNIKVILQNTESKKIILVEDDPISSRLLYTNLLCKVRDVQICRSLINLSSSTNINIVNVSDIMKNIENEGVKVNDLKMFRFLGKKEGNVIKFIKKMDKIALCDLNDLKKKIMSVNMKIDKIDDKYVVEEALSIKLENEMVILEGEESDIYYYIRDMLYDNITLL